MRARCDADRMAAALARLPPDERDALVAVLDGAHTYHEAARRLGEPDAALRSRLRSALTSLAAVLDPDGRSAQGADAAPEACGGHHHTTSCDGPGPRPPPGAH